MRNMYNRHRWASTSILMSAIFDIRHRHLLFRYWRQIRRTGKTIIPILEVFRYRHQSSFWYPILNSEYYNIKLRCLSIQIRMLDIGKNFIPIPDIMSDIALSVRYRMLRYQAQSDIADHGYRTKCPPMIIGPLGVALPRICSITLFHSMDTFLLS